MKKFVLFLGVISLDQITKYLAANDLLPSLGGLFIDPVCNSLISWSLPVEGLLFYAAWLGAIAFLVFLLQKTFWDIFLVMVLAGAISNMIDRIRLSCVIDFVQVGFFPTFNLADVFIVTGVAIFMIKLLFFSKEKRIF